MKFHAIAVVKSNILHPKHDHVFFNNSMSTI